MSRWQALAGGPSTVVVGEALLVACSLSYLLWWTVTFKPSGRLGGGGVFLAGAVLGGLGGLVLLAVGIVALLPKASLAALGATIVGGAVVGALLLYLTSTLGHRTVTTELPLIVVWATAQVAAGVTLRTAGVVSAGAATAWFVAVAIASVVGLACYLVFYRLDPVPAYWVGMVPLAVDGIVAATLAAILMLTQTP